MNLTFFEWLIAALATYRATILITRDVGPFGLFKKLRGWKRCSKLLTCPFCVSIWIGAFFAGYFYYLGRIETGVYWLFTLLSFSAITIMLDRTFTIDVTN